MMCFQEQHKHQCCFTGHRPEKLATSEVAIKRILFCAIEQAIADGYTTFLSGMCRGVDIWAAECVSILRKTNPAIHLICALPYPGFEQYWSTDWQERYLTILQQADSVQTICPTYFRGCHEKRNRWLVDHSSLVLAAYHGEAGGTKNTIQYARKHGVAVRQLLDIASE